MSRENPFCYRELRKVPRSQILHDGRGNLIHKPPHGSAHWVVTGEDIDEHVIPMPLSRPGTRTGRGKTRIITMVIPGRRLRKTIPHPVGSAKKSITRTITKPLSKRAVKISSIKRNKKAGR